MQSQSNHLSALQRSALPPSKVAKLAMKSPEVKIANFDLVQDDMSNNEYGLRQEAASKSKNVSILEQNVTEPKSTINQYKNRKIVDSYRSRALRPHRSSNSITTSNQNKNTGSFAQSHRSNSQSF